MSDVEQNVGRDDRTPWERINAQLDGDEQLDSELTKIAVEASLPAGSYVLRSQSSAWLPTGVEGVRCKILGGPGSGQPVDAAGTSARRVLLISLDPGAVYPGHPHPESEQTLVISGDLRTGDLRLGPGDFQSLPAGSEHPPQTTEGGCLCVVVCSPLQKR